MTAMYSKVFFFFWRFNLRFFYRVINAVIDVLAAAIVHPQLHSNVVDAMTKQSVTPKTEDGAASPFYCVVSFLLHTLNSTLRIPNTKSSSSALQLVLYYAFSPVLIEDAEKRTLVVPAELHPMLCLGPAGGRGPRPLPEPSDAGEKAAWGPEHAAAMLEREMSECKSRAGCETAIARCVAGLNLSPERCLSLEWLSTIRRFLASPPSAKTDYW